MRNLRRNHKGSQALFLKGKKKERQGPDFMGEVPQNIKETDPTVQELFMRTERNEEGPNSFYYNKQCYPI